MKDWTPRRRIEEVFRRELEALLDQFLRVPDAATLGQINQALVNFQNSARWLDEYTRRATNKMVTGVAISNARSWREAAAKGTHAREIFRQMQNVLTGSVDERRVELIRENAQLIGSLPERLREDTARWIAAMQLKGERPETIARHLAEQLPNVARGRLRLIARTETSKAATAITQARSEDLGLDWYIWMTSKDVRVRKSHRMMQGVLVPWADPPHPEVLAREKDEGPYHAGNIYNCRCDPVPLVDYRQVAWPARVYRNHRIQRETLNTFRRLELAA